MIFVNIVKWSLLKTEMGNFGPSENLACIAGAWKILWDLQCVQVWAPVFIAP